jgi:DNA-damage-inducible protein J
MNKHATRLRIEVDEALCTKASEVLAEIDMTLAEAVTILMNRIVADGSFPASLAPFEGSDAEEYDAWVRAKVQEALDDPRPSIPHEDVMRELRELIEAKIAAQG